MRPTWDVLTYHEPHSSSGAKAECGRQLPLQTSFKQAATVMAEDDIANAKLQCHSFLEGLLEDDDDIEEFRRLSLESKSLAMGVGQGDDSLETVIVLDDGTSDDGIQGIDTDAALLRGSPQRCCCGDRRGLKMREALRDETSGILVATGGRFPCLHIGVSGLGQNRRYLLALDFCQIASDVDLRFLEFTEPYYMPRPNHLKGRQWMGSALYFNLTSIANGGLQESAMTLKVDCEYEPTLRLLELRDDHLPSGTSAIRFTLKGSEFLVVSLTSEVRVSKDTLARKFLLVRKSEMTRGNFSPQCYRSTPSRNHLDYFPRATVRQSISQPYGEQRCFTQTDYRTKNLATRAVRSEFSDAISTSGSHVRLNAFDQTQQDFFGGSWKSMPAAQPPIPHPMWQPRGAPRPSCVPTSGHLELTTLFQRLQNSKARPLTEPCLPSRSFVAPNEARPSVPPFASQPQDFDWPNNGSAAPPVLRVNYDIVPGSYLHWVALARSSLARQAVDQSQPQQVQPSQQLQQQERQQTKQEMDTQVSSQAAAPDENGAEDSSAGIAGHSVTYFLP
ncbi:uncharacterized protein LOC120848622 [Ixodes scapularis]|uniref:uncharacterized protein LOC120848622 n=1 Tax=Ixodes scapularis TaxID=6945 RepID=UPI001C38DF5F|nr:uncharacterized protein LOC120848622 [Ixodes scapularis]